MIHRRGLRKRSGKTLHLEVQLRRRGWWRRKINEAFVRWAVSTNSLGSLTIMETGGGRGGGNCKTAEIVLVFYHPGAYSD
jgi:hypothetical protein